MVSDSDLDCPNCGAKAKHPGRAGALVNCKYCKHAWQLPMPPGAPVASGGGDEAFGNQATPIPQKGRDPLGGLVVKGIWNSIRTGHQLVYLPARDRILDFDESGRYNVWEYDRSRNSGDPLPKGVAQGTWGSIGSGHELIALGGDHVLDWESGSGAYRVWAYDRNAYGERDVFPQLVTKGTWSSIASSKRLFYLGEDRLLDWEPASGAYRIWHYDRNARGGDPLPGGPVCEGQWGTIRSGHELVYCGQNAILDWVPFSGNYRLWQFDRNARGSGDPFPRELAAGNWGSIRSGHTLINLEQARILDWEPASGAYRIWTFQL